jgi:hypothetical protein
MAAGISIQTRRTTRRMIAIPMITRAMNPKKETISTEVTAYDFPSLPKKACD